MLAVVLMLALSSNVLAAEYDFHNLKDPSKSYGKLEFAASTAKRLDVAKAPGDYAIEAKDGKLYEYKKVIAKMSEGKTFEEAIAEIEPVEKPTEGLEVVEVSAITTTAVTVDNGTSAADAIAKLDSKVTLTLSDGSTKDAAITWTADANYDGTKAGDYTFTGKITLPDGVTDPDGKVADVTAKVTVAPAQLAVTSVSAITKTSVDVTLAEAQTEAPTADKFNIKVNDEAVTATAVALKTGTDKTYTLTIPSLDNKEGNITVNGTAPAAKVAVGSDFDFDFKKPAIVSVQAKNSTTIEVVFSEKMNKTAAETRDNYRVKKVVPDTINVNTAVLGPDGKTVTLTIDKAMVDAPNGYVLEFVSTPAAGVTDLAGNKIVASERIFDGNAIADASAPKVALADYNTGTGVLTLGFTKPVSASNVDVTKLSINGVQLTAADSKTQDGDTRVKITLGATSKAAVNAITDALVLTSAAGAYKDAAGETPGETFNITKVAPANITAASYNQGTKVLTLTFDQAVKIANLAGIRIDDATVGYEATAAGATKPDGTALVLTTPQTVWELKLAKAQYEALESPLNTKTALKVFMNAGAVTNNDAGSTPNVATTYATGVAVTYTADTVKPVLASVSYTDTNNTLRFTFSELLVGTTGNYTIATAATGDTNAITITAMPAQSVVNGVQQLYAEKTDLAAGDVAKLFNQYQSGKPIKVFFAANQFTDTAGLKNDAVTFANGITLTYNDFTKPTVATVKSTTAEHVEIEFSEKVDVASAQNVANYTIKDTKDAALTVISAQVSADGKTVILKTAKQAAGMIYSMVIENVKDLAGNIMARDITKTFQGSGAVVTKLRATSLAPSAIKGAANDTLVITFNSPVVKAQAENLANYTIQEAAADTTEGWAAATTVSKNQATALLDATGKQLTITLGDANLQSGKFYRVTIANVTNIYGEAFEATYNVVKAAVTGNALAAPTVVSHVQTNNKDKSATIVFDDALNAAANTASNWTIAGNTVTSATATYDSAKKQTTVVLKTQNALVAPVAISVNANVKNLAGIALTTPITAPSVLLDTTPPTVLSVAGTSMKNDLSAYSTVTITFDKAVDKATAENKANYSIVENSVPISLANILPANITLVDNVVTIQLNTNQANPAAPANTIEYADHQLTPGTGTLAVTVSGVKDINGNTMAAAQTVSGNVTPGTPTVPNTVSASGLTPTKMKVTFDQALRSVKASDFKVEVNGIDNPVVSAELKGTTAEADRKVVILTVTNPIASSDYTGNKVQVKGGTTATEIRTVSGVALTTFTQQGVAAFGGTEVIANVATGTAVAPTTFTKSKTGLQVSDIFQITVDNGIATLKSAEFKLDGTINRTQLGNFKLYYNTTASKTGATLLGTVESIGATDNALTFTGLNKLLTKDGNNFVFVTADSKDTLEDGKTFQVGVDAGKFKVLSGVTGFDVVSTGTVSGTQIKSDITAPTITFDSSDAVTNLVLKANEPLGYANNADLKEHFTLTVAAAGSTAAITEAKYTAADNKITFTIVDDAGTAKIAAGDTISLKATLVDLAGNKTAAAVILECYDDGGTLKWKAKA